MKGKLLVSSLFLISSLSAQVRVSSLNLDKHFGPGIVGAIRDNPDLKMADIILLQEVVDGPTSHVPDEIAASLGLQVVFAPAFQLNERFHEGLAILSRYPLSDKTVIPLSHHNLHFHTRVRIAQTAIAAIPTGPVRIVNVHLDNRINAEEKRDQLEQLWPATGSATDPCIIGGDFNSANFRWISHVVPLPGVQSLQSLVDEEMRQHGFNTPLGSGPGTLHFMRLKLDWIYLRGLRPRNSGVTPITFSDHNSVWVSFLAT